ncbi:MAG: HAD family hydrolase [Erysipelotrichaceae bacterium]|nr:HAD family hydrolase [Erysipelotrichaceae bacterium]
MACFFFDLDGTFLDSNHKILDSTMGAIARLRAAGHIVAINTGRSYLGTCPILEQTQIEYAIVDGGMTIYHRHQKVSEQALDRDFVKRLYFECQSLEIDIVLANDIVARIKDDRYKNNITADHPWLSFESIIDEDNFDDVKKIFIFVDEIQAGNILVLQEVNYLYLEKTKGIVTDQNCKYQGIAKLVEYFGLEKSATVSFGDSNNDIEMLEKCDIGVAMANATDAAKKASDIVTDSNDDDGIYRALMKLGFID